MKTYAISGTIDIPDHLDIDYFLGRLHDICICEYREVEIDIDQVDDITEED